MCYREDSFLSPNAASDREQLHQLGWLGEDSPHVLELIDPMREGDVGVEVRQHPRMLLARHPALWRIVDEWNTGARRKVRTGDYRTLSNYQIIALSTMRAAYGREERREWKRAARTGGGE